MKREDKEKLSKGAASGMVALVFLILGFQLAVFVVKVIERPPRMVPGSGGERVAAENGLREPGQPSGETTAGSAGGNDGGNYGSKASGKGGGSGWIGGSRRPAERRAGRPAKRLIETFSFDPNTVSVADLQRLGLSQRQAESIENYRQKGGRFRSREDFRKMYVVSDSLYARLENFIEIAPTELNVADSAALVALRGIGPYYARKILEYRSRLGGFVDVSQLLEIEGFDQERLEGLASQVSVDASKVRRLDIWHASDSVLAMHPYVGQRGARSLVRYRGLYDSTLWSVEHLEKERVLPPENIEKLKKYIVIQ